MCTHDLCQQQQSWGSGEEVPVIGEAGSGGKGVRVGAGGGGDGVGTGSSLLHLPCREAKYTLQVLYTAHLPLYKDHTRTAHS